MKSSKKLILLAFVMLFAALSTTTFAQGYWCRDGNYDANWWNANLPSQYQLSSEQITKLNKYRADIDQKIIPLQNELRALQIEIRGYVNRNNSDPVKVKEYRNQVRDIQDQIADIRIEARQKMNSIFTDVQQGYFNDTRVGWWDGFYGRCGWDYEDMMYDDTDYGYNGSSVHRGNGCW